MGDLRRELAAAGAAARAAMDKPAGKEKRRAAAEAGGLAIKKIDGGIKEEPEEGRSAHQIEAEAPPVAVAAGDGAESARSAMEEEKVSAVPAKAPSGSFNYGSSSEKGRTADAAAVAEVSSDGYFASGDKPVAGEDTAAADDGVDGASLTSTAAGRGSSSSRKRRSAGSQGAEEGRLSPNSGRSRSVSRSSLRVAAGSAAGLEIDDGTSTTATNVRQHAQRRAAQAPPTLRHTHIIHNTQPAATIV